LLGRLVERQLRPQAPLLSPGGKEAEHDRHR
jgi:hypothetical protein